MEIGGPEIDSDPELVPLKQAIYDDKNPSIKMNVGLIYVGSLYMGTGANEISVVYDTGSDVINHLFIKFVYRP